MVSVIAALSTGIPIVFNWLAVFSVASIALALFAPTRKIAFVSFRIEAVGFSLCAFLSAVTIVYVLMGPLWVALGILTLGVPTFLLALFTLVQHGMWTDILGLVAMIFAAIITSLGRILTAPIDKKTPPPSSTIHEKRVASLTPFIDEL